MIERPIRPRPVRPGSGNGQVPNAMAAGRAPATIVPAGSARGPPAKRAADAAAGSRPRRLPLAGPVRPSTRIAAVARLRIEAEYCTQKRGLAGAIRAEQTDELPPEPIVRDRHPTAQCGCRALKCHVPGTREPFKTCRFDSALSTALPSCRRSSTSRKSRPAGSVSLDANHRQMGDPWAIFRPAALTA